jgi:hypothetical protein
MKGKKYDLEKLSSSNHFDISVSSRFYYNTQEYFDALSDFVQNFDRDLRHYTPAFVVNSDDDRANFLKECFEIRAVFTRLGITSLLDSLAVMEDAAIKRKHKEFSDGQVTYQATLQICKDTISDSAMRWKLGK